MSKLKKNLFAYKLIEIEKKKYVEDFQNALANMSHPVCSLLYCLHGSN